MLANHTLAAPIIVVPPSPIKSPIAPQRGNADILEQLLPSLVAMNKPAVNLQRIDHYLLEETEQALIRMARICGEFEAVNYTEKRGFFCANKHQNDEIQPKITTLNKDQKLQHLWTWALPNLNGLAWSQEHIHFAEHYEQDRDQAKSRFSHLTHGKRDIVATIKHAKNTLSLVLQSPTTQYLVTELSTA